MSAGSRPPRPRGLFIAALLLLTLGLAGAIALQAYRNFLDHRATAERVLHDYARLAAARFAERTEMALYWSAFSPALDALSRAKAGVAGTPLPAPSQLPAATDLHSADFHKLARYTFRLDLRNGRLETAGATPSPAVRKWLRDTLLVHSRTLYSPKYRLGAIVHTVDGVSRAIVYTLVKDGSGTARTALGLEEDPRGFDPLYTSEEDKFPLLPRPLTAGLVVAALLQLRREYELSRLRADFVSGVSHELRTPLAQIRMFSETLLLGRVRTDEERERSLEIIDQEARRLTHLVENLLHFSRSERRLTRLSPAAAPLAPLVSEAAEAFAPLAAARGVRLCTDLTDGIVAPVDADALRQMLLNLLDNAVKYGPAGQTVTLGLTLADGRALVSVDDQGPGIPAAERERIWDRFWRLERDRDSAVAGTGIGLAVVRELVALHGGGAWAEDGQNGPLPAGGRGVRFVIELPPDPSPGG